MIRLLFFLLTMHFSVSMVFAQSDSINPPDLVDLHNMKRAEEIARTVLGDSVQHSTYLVFMLNRPEYLVHKKGSEYWKYGLEQYFDEKEKKYLFRITKHEQLEENYILKRIFSENPCKRSFTYSNTDSLIYKHDRKISYMYFVLYKEGEKVCEFNLPITVTPGLKKTTYPLKREFLAYLIEILYIKDQR